MSLVQSWRRKVQNYSKREKLFLFLIIVLSIVSFALLIRVLVNTNDPNTCLTKECITAAHHVISMVDETVDPCENFYNFTCGNFLKTAIGKDQISPLLVLHDAKNNGLKQMIVEDRNDETNLTKSFRYQRKFYRACMNTTAIDENKDESFLEDLRHVVGGWPLSQGYVLDLFWPDVMLRARERGMLYNWFFTIDTDVDYKRRKVLLELSPPPKLYYDKNVWNEKNIQKFVEIADYWGKQPIGATAWEVKNTLDFAKNLSIIVENAHKYSSNETDNKKFTMKISKLRELHFPRLQWLQYLQNFTGVQSLSENDEIIFKMKGDEYFKDLYYLLQKTDTKFWANYISIIFLIEDCRYLSTKVKKICKDLISSSMQNQRADFCFHRALSKFEGVVEAQYIRKTVTKDKVKDITAMIESIKKEMEVTLKRTKWMDERTKEKAVKHLKNITSAIGWTKTVFDEALFEKLFGYVQGEISSTNVTRMNHELNRFYCDYHFKKIKQPFNDLRENHLSLPMVEVNAFYIKYWEILILAAPILQPLIYDIKWPKYLTYGSLGSIIGHELTHAFAPMDEDNFKMQKYYGYNITDYWTNQTHKNYDAATGCMVEEYVRYTKEIDIKLENKTKTLNENIADFTGVNLAYRAYQTWAYFKGEDKKLPGLKFTSNQLFWILSSMYQCIEPKLESGAYVHPEIEPSLSHAIASFRVNGPIRNSPYFAYDFGCPEGTKMNPKEKCGIFV
ncbi:neprilysin-2-like [Anthonomus grandis grandis]|uniref:neprilysin-2-like n=1 Tax=Anthonomus grandis grandis TaxID=2921223 RepID=UPI0021663EA6|nr:neprilysin-2-like [Anthonomus grandis grandis]